MGHHAVQTLHIHAKFREGVRKDVRGFQDRRAERRMVLAIRPGRCRHDVPAFVHENAAAEGPGGMPDADVRAVRLVGDPHLPLIREDVTGSPRIQGNERGSNGLPSHPNCSCGLADWRVGSCGNGPSSKLYHLAASTRSRHATRPGSYLRPRTYWPRACPCSAARRYQGSVLLVGLGPGNGSRCSHWRHTLLRARVAHAFGGAVSMDAASRGLAPRDRSRRAQRASTAIGEHARPAQSLTQTTPNPPCSACGNRFD